MYVVKPTEDNVLISPDMELSYGEMVLALQMTNSEVRYEGRSDQIDVDHELILWVYDHDTQPDNHELDESKPCGAIKVKVTGCMILLPENFLEAAADIMSCIVFEAVVLRRTPNKNLEADESDLVFGILQGESNEGFILEADPRSDYVNRLIAAMMALNGTVD